MGDVEVVLMHPLMVLIRQLPVLIRGIEGGALVSTTGAKAWIGGAHRVEYSILFPVCSRIHVFCKTRRSFHIVYIGVSD